MNDYGALETGVTNDPAGLGQCHSALHWTFFVMTHQDFDDLCWNP